MSELSQWGKRVDALTGEAHRQGVRLERSLRWAQRALGRAQREIAAAEAQVGPTAERTHRIDEVARAASDAGIRTDLLALNFQVEAARQGEEDERGLARVADDIRSLADQTVSGAAETRELADALRTTAETANTAWGEGLERLEEAQAALDQALRATQETADALAQARAAAAEFAAGAEAAGAPTGGPVDADSARRLAAAAEVREATIRRLGEATAAHLRRLSLGLLNEAAKAEGGATRVQSGLSRLSDLSTLVRDADEIARRAKQLALNAELFAGGSDDPAFELFAEEARRLSDHAEASASATHARLQSIQSELEPEVSASHERGSALRELAADMERLLGRFGGEPGAVSEDEADLARAWSEDRAAARQLREARTRWRGAE